MRTKSISLILILLVATLSGCASQANRDPLEGLNRGVYKFNDAADKVVIKPVATVYKKVLPSPIRTGVNNIFNNLGTLVTAVNDILQFKFSNAADDLGRLVINSTVGLVGILDVASMDNVPRHNEDFGQTLGYWGVGNGPYIVLPLLGPSTLRDTGGLVVDTSLFDPISYLPPAPRNSMFAAKLIDKRSQYLPASDLLDEAALDPYAFMRDAYLQRRANQISDGAMANADDDFETAPADSTK